MTPFQVLPLGATVLVTCPEFPPMSNRGKLGRVVAIFDFPISQLHYHVEIDGVVYDYAPGEITCIEEQVGRRAA